MDPWIRLGLFMMKKSTTPLQEMPDSVSSLSPESKTTDPTSVLAHVSCALCQHEIPLSETVVPEALDYVIYFCGLDCYDRWRAEANG